MKNSRYRKRLRKLRRQSGRWRLLLILAIVGFNVSFMTHVATRLRTNPQLLLVPQITAINLPDPLILSTVNISVLGAATFDAVDIITYVNVERQNRGIMPLRINLTLMSAAQKRADVILKHQNFSHQDPYEKIELTTVLPQMNYHYAYASENIGMGGVSGANFVYGFMHSTAHRENLLNPHLSETGAGLSTGWFGNNYVNIAVQLFAIPSGKDEYLGYTQDDILLYRDQLNRVNRQLYPLDWLIGRITNREKYSDRYYSSLLRQKEILSQINNAIREEKPFTNDHVAMIREYNNLLL